MTTGRKRVSIGNLEPAPWGAPAALDERERGHVGERPQGRDELPELGDEEGMKRHLRSAPHAVNARTRATSDAGVSANWNDPTNRADCSFAICAIAAAGTGKVTCRWSIGQLWTA